MDSYCCRHDMVFEEVVYTFLIGYDGRALVHHCLYEGGFFANEVCYHTFCYISSESSPHLATVSKTLARVDVPPDFEIHDLMEEVVRDACLAAGFSEERRKYINHWLLGEGSGVL